MPDAFEYWEAKAEELARTNVDRIRASARAWAATVSALLGLFGMAVVVEGPESVRRLTGGAQVAVALFLTAAAVLLAAAVLTTAWAAQGFPTKKRVLTGPELAAWSIEESGRASRLLRAGRVSGFLAALAVVGAGLVSVWAAKNRPSSEVHVMVRTEDGGISCGPLVQSDDGLAIDLGDEEMSLVEGIADAQIVESCGR